MGTIFLSYRREDAEGQAGRLYDDLVAVFGSDSVFMDVAAIQPGRDFRKVIDQSLSSCGVFLSLIGKNWITATDASGRRRIDDPADFVRIETAAALKRDIPVIPVLVQGAPVLRPDQLPGDLQDLAYRNAIELTHPRWDSDIQLLINSLRPHVSNTIREPRSKEMGSGGKTRIPKSLVVTALALAAAVGLTFYLWPGKKVADSPANKSVETTLLQPAANASSYKATKPGLHQANAPSSKSVPKFENLEDFSLAAVQQPLPNNPKRYTYTLSLNAPAETISDIVRVHYDLVYDPNPLSLDGGPAPAFSAQYEGWGCYETVAVSVYFKTESEPGKKTFNMCKALNQ